MSNECTFIILTPLNVNLIFVLFLVVVSTGIETPLEFLFSSFLGVMVITGPLGIPLLVVVLFVVSNMVVSGVVEIGVVVGVIEGLLNKLIGLPFGFVNVG